MIRMLNSIIMNIENIFNYEFNITKDFGFTISELLIAIIILVFARLLISLVNRIIKRQSKRKKVDAGTYHAIYQIFKYIVWVFAVLLALDTIGAKITLFLAGSAALLVGIGLGLQQVFQDFISGIVLLFEGSLKVGDVVELQEGTVGQVKEIGIRTSKIETRNNIIMIIPNSKFISDNVINWSHHDKKSRFNVDVGVAYGSDVELVRRILIESATDHKDISKSPKPFVRFEDFGDSSLDFKLYFWTSNIFYVENTKSDLRFIINRKFKKNNVQIPFPQRDVHIRSKV